MQKLPISVFIIAKDEEDRIPYSIKSVIDWVDEVIVIDSGSSDDTVKVAKSLGAKTIFNKWPGYGQQKIFGEQQCKNNWLLNIDADEEITKSLRDEIITLFANGSPAPQNAYKLKCKLMFMHQNKPSRFAHINAPIRLYNKATASFRDSTVHDAVIPTADVQVHKLVNIINHRSFRGLHHMIEKSNKYTTMLAQDLYKKGKKPSIMRLLFEPLTMFLKAYFIRRFCLYGSYGFVHSITHAYFRTARLAKTRELFKNLS